MKNIVTVIILLLVSLQTACAPSPPKPFVGPNGKTAYQISCSTLNKCYKQAGEFCPKGYSVIDRSSEFSEIVGHYKNMSFECK